MSSVAGKTLADFPDLVKQIDREKQPDLNPDDIAAGSGKEIWWKCPKGPDHGWESKPYERCARGSGCPYCTGRKLSVTNRLDILYPKIAKEWHPTRNGSLKPNQVKAGSHTTKAWWLCGKCGNEWKTPVIGRTWRNNGCRKCGNFRGGAIRSKPIPSKSFGDLHPELLEELHSTKNKEFDAFQVRPGTGKKPWWVCKTCSHEWKSTPQDRIRGHGCRMCGYEAASKIKMTPEKGNSLLERYHEIAKQWHPSKNGKIMPKHVNWGGSKVKYWWKCLEGPDHEWEAIIAGRTGGSEGCPFCSGRIVSVTNSLESLRPEIAKLYQIKGVCILLENR